jgi:hypothetical protein
MHILNSFEAVYKSHVLSLVKKGLECRVQHRVDTVLGFFSRGDGGYQFRRGDRHPTLIKNKIKFFFPHI